MSPLKRNIESSMRRRRRRLVGGRQYLDAPPTASHIPASDRSSCAPRRMRSHAPTGSTSRSWASSRRILASSSCRPRRRCAWSAGCSCCLLLLPLPRFDFEALLNQRQPRSPRRRYYCYCHCYYRPTFRTATATLSSPVGSRIAGTDR